MENTRLEEEEKLDENASVLMETKGAVAPIYVEKVVGLVSFWEKELAAINRVQLLEVCFSFYQKNRRENEPSPMINI